MKVSKNKTSIQLESAQQNNRKTIECKTFSFLLVTIIVKFSK